MRYHDTCNNLINETTMCLTSNKTAFTMKPLSFIFFVLCLALSSCEKDSMPSSRVVDLGLPSGVKWADRNIGAPDPKSVGSYFAWGEVEPRPEISFYENYEYKWRRKLEEYTSFSKYNEKDKLTLLEKEDDAAYVNWGKHWRMPTEEEIRELEKYCTWRSEQKDGKWYYVATGPNGKEMFFPESSYASPSNHMVDASLSPMPRIHTGSYLWSSELRPNQTSSACVFSEDKTVLAMPRYWGLNIRAVYSK